MSRVLIIDDDEGVRYVLSRVVQQHGFQARAAETLAQGLALAEKEGFDVVFLDVRLPDGDGLTALPRLRAGDFPPEVIIMTGHGDRHGAELAITMGAWDYVLKPASLSELALPMLRALQYREEQKRSQHPMTLDREGIIGDSRPLRSCLDQVAHAAATEAAVLIRGETGSGKELLTWAIHRNSRRAPFPGVVVDCSALPVTLAESILFGYRKGAFTGAEQDRVGLIGQAHQGTLFLDEVAELPLELQKSFLRVLQEKRYRPLGDSKERTSDFRLVSATNRDLEAMVRDGTFREDLFFRISSLVIEVPPLRQRRDDIRDLVVHYVGEMANRYRTGSKGFSPDFFEVLSAYDWPGNVRELVNTLERVFARAGNEPIFYAYHLPDNIRIGVAKASIGESDDHAAKPWPDRSFPTFKVFREEALKRVETEYLSDLLNVTGGDVQKAIRLSGLSRSHFYGLLRRNGLPTPQRKRS